MKNAPRRDRFLEEAKAGIGRSEFEHLSLEARAVINEIDANIMAIALEALDELGDETATIEHMPLAYLYAIPQDHAEMEKITDELLEAGFLKPAWKEGQTQVYYHHIDRQSLYEGIKNGLAILKGKAKRH